MKPTPAYIFLALSSTFNDFLNRRRFSVGCRDVELRPCSEPSRI